MPMNERSLDVVFDTSIFLQATFSRTGPAARVLRLLEAGAFTLYVSDELMEEIRDVLTRPELRRKSSQYTDEDIEEFIARIETQAVRLSDLPEHFHYARDPDDEHVINLAILAVLFQN